MCVRKVLIIGTIFMSLGLFLVANPFSSNSEVVNLEMLDATADDKYDEIDPWYVGPSTNSVIPPFWGGLY